MIPPMKIFQCINGHSLCENCKANVKIANCPSCRVPIQGDQMTRNILAESFIEAAMNKGHNDENASKDASPSSEPPFLLVSSCGPSADHQGSLLGLYRKSEEEIREGRSVYIQEHDTQYRGSHSKLTSAQGVWRIVDEHGNVYLRAAKIIESPISSVKWEYKLNGKTWEEDLALTVTGLSEKPSECEITITLPDITEPGVAGVYKGDGSYYQGRPVLRQSRGRFTLFAGSGCWIVSPGVGGAWYLMSGSALSQCPADPKVARKRLLGLTHCWMYRNKQKEWTVSRGIIVKCNKHTN